MTETSRTARRIMLALTVGSLGLATAACGSSSSGSPASSSTTVQAASPSASDSSSPASSTSSSAPASSSTARFSATQLDKAVAATTSNGVTFTPMAQSQLKQVRELMADTAKHMQGLTYSPADCKMAASMGQIASGASMNVPMSIGEDKAGKHTIAAAQLAAGAPDSWSNTDELVKKCSNMTVKGNMSGIPVDMKLSMSPLTVTSTEAQQVHAMVQTIEQKGRTQVQSIAVGRVGDVMVESEMQGRATPQELGTQLDALAAQVKKLG